MKEVIASSDEAIFDYRQRLNTMQAIAQLKEKITEIRHLTSAISVLEWDKEVFMPKKGSATRAKTISLLTGIAHEKFVSEEFERLLKQSESEVSNEKSGEVEQRMIKHIRYDFNREKKLPKAFVEQLAKTTAEAHHIWADARKDSNFQSFAPILRKIVELKRQEASYVGFDNTPYDALLDVHERGATTEKVSILFQEVKDFLVPFIERILKSKIISYPTLNGDFEIQKQKRFNELISKPYGIMISEKSLKQNKNQTSNLWNQKGNRTIPMFPTGNGN